MAGSAINRALRKSGYGEKDNKGIIFTSRRELDLLNIEEVIAWFKKINLL